MRAVATLLLVGLTVIGVTAQSAAPKIAELKGAQLPEHWVWRTIFNHLAFAKANKRAAVLDSLNLPKSELDIVLRAAERQPERDMKCQEKLEQRLGPLMKSGAKVDVLEAAQQEVRIACRLEVLDVRGRLLAALSEESQAVLRAWVDERRNGMTYTVPEREVRSFMQP